MTKSFYCFRLALFDKISGVENELQIILFEENKLNEEY